jgi:hypothetical protein
VHAKLLQNFLAASEDQLDGLGHLANLLATFDKKGRNPLHTLALSGSAALVDDLVAVFSALDDRKSRRGRRVRGKLAMALTATDIRGHSPVAYAALRFGPRAAAYLSFRRLAALARADLDEAALHFLFRSHKDFRGSSDSERPPEGLEGEGGGGGWSEAVLPEQLRGDPDRCDILEVGAVLCCVVWCSAVWYSAVWCSVV